MKGDNYEQIFYGVVRDRASTSQYLNGGDKLLKNQIFILFTLREADDTPSSLLSRARSCLLRLRPWRRESGAPSTFAQHIKAIVNFRVFVIGSNFLRSHPNLYFLHMEGGL